MQHGYELQAAGRLEALLYTQGMVAAHAMQTHHPEGSDRKVHLLMAQSHQQRL